MNFEKRFYFKCDRELLARFSKMAEEIQLDPTAFLRLIFCAFMKVKKKEKSLVLPKKLKLNNDKSFNLSFSLSHYEQLETEARKMGKKPASFMRYVFTLFTTNQKFRKLISSGLNEIFSEWEVFND